MNTKEILIKLKDAIINNALDIGDVPINDIKEALIAEYTVAIGKDTIEYNRLFNYCSLIPDTGLNKNETISFIDRMINYSIEISNHTSVNTAELPDNIDPYEQYQTYLELSEHYKTANINQYYLCLENAYFHCKDAKTKQEIHDKMTAVKNSGHVTVKPASIVIVSYNCMYLMQKCIESIRNYCYKPSYEIIVVDNASTDGVTDWLEQQPDIILIKSNTNLGFPKGCNIGILNSKKENDIFLLNNDTRLTPNSLFWLRMGLYKDEETGATGAICNYDGTLQYRELFFTALDDYIRYGYINNVPMKNAYEECTILCGFAMMLKRQALDKTNLLDENLSPGYYDDDDISMQLRKLGYRLYVCHNSFIYHAGSQSFGALPSDSILNICSRNRDYIWKKWGFDPLNNSIGNIFKMIYATAEPLALLEINAHNGASYAHLSYICPKLRYVGYESNLSYIPLTIKEAHITYTDYDNIDFYQYNKEFNYIIINNATEYNEAERNSLYARLYGCLKADGQLIWNDNTPHND